jgi:hypothetical protein
MNYEVPEKISDMTFPQKVHHMLCQEEYKKWIGWLPHGRAFRILVPKLLEKSQLLQKYFGHGRYSSFLRQLSNHGFKHISSGPDRNTYYHEVRKQSIVTSCFNWCRCSSHPYSCLFPQFILCGLPHLTKYMPEPKDSRRLIPDPDNEPNFYAISSEYPLPDDPDFYMVEPVEDSEEPKKRAANAPVAAPRLASEASWFNNEMPPAKRPAFERNTDAAASRFNTVPASALSRLQDAITSPPELSWFNGRMPPGLMYDTEAVGGLMASSEAVSHVPLVPPITSSLAQLQDAINMNRNNQLMAVALRAQHLGSLPQQQVPELGSNPLMAEIVAAMLRSRGL